MNNLYDIAVFLLGELPQEFKFAYIILTLVICIVYVIVILAPFVFIYRWFKKD